MLKLSRVVRVEKSNRILQPTILSATLPLFREGILIVYGFSAF
jgi:hypothetical protein